MAILTVCKKCLKRSAGALDQCPHCQNGNVRFILDYRPSGRYGKRVRQDLPESVTTARGARDIESLSQKIRKKKIASEPKKLKRKTVKDLFPKYLDDYSEIYHTPSTHADIHSVYNAHYSKILGAQDVENTDDMELYIKMRRAENAAARTINKELDYYSGFRKWLYKKYKIPLPADRPQKLTAKRPLPQILGIDEVIKILDNAEPFYRAFFLCLYSVGLRMNEVRQLRWKDIDFKNRLIRVIQKGGSYKILPVSDWLVGILEDIKPDIKPGEAESMADRFVFLNEQTGRPVMQVRKALARACKKAEITRRVYPHLFRHSVATFLMGKNINMRLIQGYMGHSKIGTTEFYTHVAVENLREAEKAVQDSYDAVRKAQKKAACPPKARAEKALSTTKR